MGREDLGKWVKWSRDWGGYVFPPKKAKRLARFAELPPVLAQVVRIICRWRVVARLQAANGALGGKEGNTRNLSCFWIFISIGVREYVPDEGPPEG